jgi:hypothetical protein
MSYGPCGAVHGAGCNRSCTHSREHLGGFQPCGTDDAPA